jgi:hypothetical protein
VTETELKRWEADVRRHRRTDRAILISWGLAVLMLAGMFSFWIWRSDRQQDRDMCAMTSVFLGGPEPVAGPNGERSRTVRKAIETYRQGRSCSP